jgi:hypothetical protein
MRILFAPSQEGSFVAEISAVERKRRQVVSHFGIEAKTGFVVMV